MAKWYSAAIQENGLAHLKTLAAGGKTITQHIVNTYSAGDSYATVVTNSLMSVAIANGDMVWSDGASASRVLTIAEKADVSITASSSTPDLHIVIVNTTDSEVHVANDETTNQALVSGGTKTIPAWTLVSPQPV
jgi:hypothetical protein